MPNLQNHTTSYELSKELHDLCKEKGIKLPESLFWWIYIVKSQYKEGDDFATTEQGWILSRAPWEGGKNSIPAYISSELGEILLKNNKDTLLTAIVEDKYRIANWSALTKIDDKRFDGVMIDSFDSGTEVDSRIKMLIFMIKNNLIEL